MNKKLSAAEKDANVEAWSKRIQRDGAPPHLLVFFQDGRVSVSSNLPIPLVRMVLETIGPQFEKSGLLEDGPPS